MAKFELLIATNGLRLGRARSLKLRQEEVVPSNVKLSRSHSVGILTCLYPILSFI